MNFLAKKIIGVVSELLPGPVAIIDYLSRLDRHYANEDKLLEWDNPSDFHVTNRYNKTKVDTVYLPGGTEFRGQTAIDLNLKGKNLPVPRPRILFIATMLRI